MFGDILLRGLGLRDIDRDSIRPSALKHMGTVGICRDVGIRLGIYDIWGYTAPSILWDIGDVGTGTILNPEPQRWYF